jgi:hypothetical protein
VFGPEDILGFLFGSKKIFRILKKVTVFPRMLSVAHICILQSFHKKKNCRSKNIGIWYRNIFYFSLNFFMCFVCNSVLNLGHGLGSTLMFSKRIGNILVWPPPFPVEQRLELHATIDLHGQEKKLYKF